MSWHILPLLVIEGGVLKCSGKIPNDWVQFLDKSYYIPQNKLRNPNKDPDQPCSISLDKFSIESEKLNAFLLQMSQKFIYIVFS